jgi:Tfp pilus assembly protein PilZ
MRLRQSFGVKRQVTAVVENLSGDGAFLRTTETINPGEQVFVVFRLSGNGNTGPHVAARGRVVRAERQSNGSVGIGVQFSSHRFL